MKFEKSVGTVNRDELELVALQIDEVRDTLRELSRQVLRIERQLKAVLPARQTPSKLGRGCKLEDNAATKMIDKLTENARKGMQIENELRQLTVKNDLTVLAKKLGMTNAKLPPKDELVRRISSRLRQRASVTSGIRESAQTPVEAIN